MFYFYLVCSLYVYMVMLLGNYNFCNLFVVFYFGGGSSIVGSNFYFSGGGSIVGSNFYFSFLVVVVVLWVVGVFWLIKVVVGLYGVW